VRFAARRSLRGAPTPSIRFAALAVASSTSATGSARNIASPTHRPKTRPCPHASKMAKTMTGMGDKPRRSGRGRIPPGSLSEPCQTMLLQERCRERDLAPGRGKVTPAEIRTAQQGTRPRNPAVPTAQAAQSESLGLQAGEDVNKASATEIGGGNGSRLHREKAGSAGWGMPPSPAVPRRIERGT